MPGRSERVSRLPRFQSARGKSLRYYRNTCPRTLFPSRSFHKVRSDDTEPIGLVAFLDLHGLLQIPPYTDVGAGAIG